VIAASCERAVILVIDTSSAKSAIALLTPSGEVIREELHLSGRTFDLPERFRSLAGDATLSKIAVATGPGSFTGLRVGVSFGLGLAIGLRVPIVPLATLAIQASRSEDDVVAVAEAGRGRVYYAAVGGPPALAEPAGLPSTLAVVGWLRPSTEEAIRAAGLEMRQDSELRSFGRAAWLVLETAPEAPYGSLQIQYMQSFSVRA